MDDYSIHDPIMERRNSVEALFLYDMLKINQF